MYFYPYPYFCPAIEQEPWETRNMRNMEMEDEVSINIPEMPILGQLSMKELLDKLCKSIIDEATAVEFYTRLEKDAPDEMARDFIKHAAKDEAKHLKAFTKLYKYLSMSHPKYTIEPVKYESFKDGVKKALMDELDAVDSYRDIILSTSDHLVKDTFFLAMTDEMEHATRFGVLYNMA